MVTREFTLSIASFNNTTSVSDPIDITSFEGCAFGVVVTGASGAGTMKLQGSFSPAVATSWFDIPATLGGATVSQTITVGTTPHYLNTGNIAYYPSVRVSVTSTNTNPITVAIVARAKG